MVTSGGSVPVGFRFFAIAELVARKGEIGKPTQKKNSCQAQYPVFFNIINNYHRLRIGIR